MSWLMLHGELADEYEAPWTCVAVLGSTSVTATFHCPSAQPLVECSQKSEQLQSRLVGKYYED